MAENKYYGIYQGKVSNVKDPEKRGRIKIQCPTVLGSSAESAWCDPCVNVAYDGGGDIAIPPLNETVWVMFIEGDSNRPVWLGSWWSANKSPLGDGYDEKVSNRVIKWKGNTITMSDGGISIESSGTITIKGSSIRLNP